jgi:tetratricopeptide (TPR) repeat protein
MAEKLDEKARSAFKEGLAHLQQAQQWKEQQDADRRDAALKNARKRLDKVVQRAPYFDEGWVNLSHVYVEMRDFSLAKYVLDKALEYSPRSEPALIAKAEILEKQGAYAGAARLYGRIHQRTTTAGFDYRKQRVLDRIIEHDNGQPTLTETEEVLHQIPASTFGWNGAEAQKATITLTTNRVICIGEKVPDQEQGVQTGRFRRRSSSKSPLDRRDILGVTIPLDTIEATRKIKFYARYSIHIWDHSENHLVLLDLPEPDIKTIISLLGDKEIKTGEVEAKLCTLFLVMFVGSVLLSVALML